MKAMIFDMDGTLADVSSIVHHLNKPLNQMKIEALDLYHELSVDVPPVEKIVKATHSAHDLGYAVLIVTARRQKYMDLTGEFICKNDIYCDVLFMREDDDDSSDYDLKRKILSKIRWMGFDVERAYDDNLEIIKLWKEEGIEVIHVTGYGFDYTLTEGN